MIIQTDGTAAGTILYEYQPSASAAIIFIAVFGVAAILHCAGMIWLRVAYFIPLLIGCIMECFGYYGRYWGSQSPNNFGAYVLQGFMLILAPIFFSATVYMSLARLISALQATHEPPIASRWLSILFVLGDVICFLIQLAGLGMQATTSQSIQEGGQTTILVGLIVQCILTAVFIFTTVIFSRKLIARDPRLDINWKSFVYALEVVGVFLLIRNIVRVAEYAQGAGGFVTTHEVFVYLFDALPMFGLVLTLLIWHAGRVQRKTKQAWVVVEDKS